MQVQDLINAAMRTAGILAAGELSADPDLTDAIFDLNQMLDSWSAERLLIPNVTRSVLTLAANTTGSYQVGPSAVDFPNVARPLKIQNAGIIIAQPAAQPVEIPLRILTDDEWADIETKNIPTSIPTALYCDYAYPFSTLYTWPALNTGASLALYTWQPLAQFVNPTDTVQFPPGYSEALRYNLAGRLAIEYGQEPNPIVVQLALDLKDRLKMANPAEYTMRADGSSGPRSMSFNIYTGETV